MRIQWLRSVIRRAKYVAFIIILYNFVHGKSRAVITSLNISNQNEKSDDFIWIKYVHICILHT